VLNVLIDSVGGVVDFPLATAFATVAEKLRLLGRAAINPCFGPAVASWTPGEGIEGDLGLATSGDVGIGTGDVKLLFGMGNLEGELLIVVGSFVRSKLV
jgi:hypothetical protein